MDFVMREEPSPPLVEMLARLELAGAGEFRLARRRARQLARDLPLFDSVWVDALVYQRTLTPYQATELNAGRGDALALGPLVIAE